MKTIASFGGLASVVMIAACGSSDSTAPPDGGAPGDASPAGDGSVADGGAASDGALGDGAAGTCGSTDSFVPDWVKNAQPTKEVYVSPTGSDANDGSAATPFKTSAKAFSGVVAGVRINYKAGNYDCPPFQSNVLATTASPIIVRAIDGARTAKFDCGGTGDFFFSHVRAIVLDGLEIFHTAGHGVQLDSGSGLATKDLSTDFVLMRSFVHDTQLAGIKVAQSQRIYVLGNEFAHCGAGRQCVELVASDMPVIVGNDAHDSDAFNEVKGGAHGGIIARNRIHDMNAGGGGILVGGDCTGQQFLVDPAVDFEAKDLYVWGNVITGANAFAFRVVGCHDCIVANNTYFGSAPTAILRILHDAFASPGSSTCDVPLHNSNVRIANNLFAWVKSSIDVIPTDESTANVSFDHNLWFAAGDDVTKLFSDMPFVGDATSLYNQDPKLVSPPMDPSLGAASPAIGAGRTIAEVGGTFDGACPSSPPNIGAYAR